MSDQGNSGGLQLSEADKDQIKLTAAYFNGSPLVYCWSVVSQFRRALR